MYVTLGNILAKLLVGALREHHGGDVHGQRG